MWTDREKKRIILRRVIPDRMSETSIREALAPLALLCLPVAVYLLVLFGAVPTGYSSGVVLTAVAGAATLGAVAIRERIPAVAAGIATVGYGLGVVMSGFVVTVGAWLVVLGGIGFIASTTYSAGTHVYESV